MKVRAFPPTIDQTNPKSSRSNNSREGDGGMSLVSCSIGRTNLERDPVDQMTEKWMEAPVVYVNAIGRTNLEREPVDE